MGKMDGLFEEISNLSNDTERLINQIESVRDKSKQKNDNVLVKVMVIILFICIFLCLVINGVVTSKKSNTLDNNVGEVSNSIQISDNRVEEISSTSFLTLTPTTKSNAITDKNNSQKKARISNQVSLVNIRKSPGYIDKNDKKDVVTKIPTGETVIILSGPKFVDSINWYYVDWDGYEGWIADRRSNGDKILEFYGN